MHFEFLSRLNGVVFLCMNLLEASAHIDDDSKTQIISKCLHDSYSFKNKEYISGVFKGCLANFTIKI